MGWELEIAWHRSSFDFIKFGYLSQNKPKYSRFSLEISQL